MCLNRVVLGCTKLRWISFLTSRDTLNKHTWFTHNITILIFKQAAFINFELHSDWTPEIYANCMSVAVNELCFDWLSLCMEVVEVMLPRC